MKKIRYSTDLVEFFKGHIEHVFLYITNKCDLRCKQCFYASQLGTGRMTLEHARHHMISLAELGAKRLTLLGGEPTTYDAANNWRQLSEILASAFDCGYENVRIDTNGQFQSKFLKILPSNDTLELSFSLDGAHGEENDILRGEGTFKRCLENLRASQGIVRRSVTMCVNRHNMRDLPAAVGEICRLGIESLNFHPLLLAGNHQDVYIKDDFIKDDQWLTLSNHLMMLSTTIADVKFRIPPRFGHRSTPTQNVYCSIKSRDRAHVQLNGEIRICPLNIGSPLRTAYNLQDEIVLETTTLIEPSDPSVGCAAQKQRRDPHQPLCVSYKPEVR